ncbi:hypothetical protein [Ammoniphilus sp. 3BR4]|uniref:hypothetical protein n=1 Tax=Ammoniphilus sp. 3BR4 TaxID=3158265 RepID=UPI003466F95F
MDIQHLEELGEHLRSLGHRRRELVERILSEVDEGDRASSKNLYQELSQISEDAIFLMQKQKSMIDEEISKLQ